METKTTKTTKTTKKTKVKETVESPKKPRVTKKQKWEVAFTNLKEKERKDIEDAFVNAICSVRATGKMTIEDQIKFYELGINGTTASKLVTDLITQELSLFKENKEPTFQNMVNFLNAVTDKFEGCTQTRV